MESAYAVAFVDESQFVGGCSGGTVRRWKIEDRQEQGLRFGNGGTAILSIAASQDGRWIVAGNEEVVVWNAVTGKKSARARIRQPAVPGDRHLQRLY